MVIAISVVLAGNWGTVSLTLSLPEWVGPVSGLTQSDTSPASSNTNITCNILSLSLQYPSRRLLNNTTLLISDQTTLDHITPHHIQHTTPHQNKSGAEEI